MTDIDSFDHHEPLLRRADCVENQLWKIQHQAICVDDRNDFGICSRRSLHKFVDEGARVCGTNVLDEKYKFLKLTNFGLRIDASDFKAGSDPRGHTCVLID